MQRTFSEVQAERPIEIIDLSDLSTASAVAVAQTGLQSVKGAIQVILAAIFSGQTAPASFRDQVEAGLNLADSALSNITE